MKTIIGSHACTFSPSKTLRLLGFVTLAAFGGASVYARDELRADVAAERLTHHGTVALEAAGPYVEVGTMAIQVTVKLGRPTAKLADGTWLYRGYHIETSDARGTLVVRFANNRVIGLSLVTPAAATAMMTTEKSPAKVLASNGR